MILDITAALRRGGGGQYYLTPPPGGHFYRTPSPGALPLASPTSSEGSSVGLNWQKMRSRGVSATLASTLSRPRWGMPSTKLSTPSATELSMIWFKAGIRTYRPQGSSNNMAVRTTHKGLCSSGDGPWTASWNTPHHTLHILHPSHPSPPTHTSQPSHSHPSPHTPHTPIPHLTPLTLPSLTSHPSHSHPSPHNPHTPIPHLTPLQTKPFLTGPLPGEKAFEPCGVNEPLEQQLTLTVLEVTAARQLKLGPAQTPPHVTTHLCTLNCVCVCLCVRVCVCTPQPVT